MKFLLPVSFISLFQGVLYILSVFIVARLYLIYGRKEQFNDIFSQENTQLPGSVWVEDHQIDLLRNGPPATPNHLLDLLPVNYIKPCMMINSDQIIWFAAFFFSPCSSCSVPYQLHSQAL